MFYAFNHVASLRAEDDRRCQTPGANGCAGVVRGQPVSSGEPTPIPEAPFGGPAPLQDRSTSSTTIDRPALAFSIAMAFSQDAIYGLIFLSYMNHYLLDVLKTSPGLPAYTLAIYGATKLLVHPIAGRVLDRTSPRALFRGAIAVQASGLLVVLAVHTLWAFLGGACLIAAGGAAIWPLLYDTIARTQPTATHSHATGVLTLAGYIATGAGFATGVLLGNFGPRRAPFYLALAMIGALFLGQRMRALDAGTSHPTHAKVHEPVGLRARIGAAAAFGLVVFVDYAAITSLAGVYGPYVRRSLHITLLHATVLLIPAGIVGLAALMLASRVSRPDRRLAEMAFFYLLSAAGAFGMAWARTPIESAALATLVAAGAGGIGPIIAASMIEQGGGPADRGLVIGALMSIEGLGSVAGPAVAALVIDAVNPRAGMTFIGATFTLLIPLTYLVWRRGRGHPAAAF